MPKRLYDITCAFERTTKALEDAEDALIHATKAARAKFDACAQSHHDAYDDLHRYLKDYQDVVVVAGDYGYRFDRGQIARAKIVWAHHVWVIDPTPVPSYRVPTAAKPWPNMAAVLEPHAGESWDVRAGKAAAAFIDAATEPRAGEARPLSKLGDAIDEAFDSIDPIHTAEEFDEPRAGEADLSAEGEAALDKVRATWKEPNGDRIAID